MASIIESTEEHGLDRVPALGTMPRTRGGAVTRAAVEITDQLNASCICAFTQTGDSARRLSRLRPGQAVYAFTPSPATLNVLTLAWGIKPLQTPFIDHTDAMSAYVDRQLQEQRLARPGELVVIAAGSPPGKAGSTNLLKVHRIGDQDD